MAFNPFHSLRKHRKTGLAALAIMCMLLFVFQTGMQGGDTLDYLRSWLGGRQIRGDDLALMNGQRITQMDLAEVKARRQLADVYMKEITERVIQMLRNQANVQDSLAPGEGARHGQAIISLQVLYPYLHPVSFNPRFRRPAFFESFEFDPEEAQANPFAAENLVDFLVWKDQARKLGINLTDEGVNEEINRILFRNLSNRISAPIENLLMADPRFKGMSIIDVLRDELNVRQAKATLLGHSEPPIGLKLHEPVSITPQEFWAYFKDQRTELDIALLPIKVEDFLPQVTAEPTEADLKKLYERGKEREYHPEYKEAGFRQPRKIQVQWVGGSPDSAYYRQEAVKLVAVNDALVLFTGLTPTTPLAGVLPMAVNAATPLAADVPVALAARYMKERGSLSPFGELPLQGYQWSSHLRRPLRKQTVFRPEVIAAVVAGTAGDRALGAWPLWQGLGVAQEMAYRAELAANMITLRSPIANAALAALEMPREPAQPYAAVKEWVQDRYLDQLARDVLAHNLDTIRKEVDELRKNNKLADLDKVVANLAEKLHLQTGKSALRDRNQDPIADDAGIRPLRDAYLRMSSDTRRLHFGFSDDKLFDITLFTQTGVHQAETWPHTMPGDRDRDLWRSAPELFYVWKTQDQPDKIVPLSDPKIHEAVTKAWRWQRARELAKKEAERIAKDAAPLKGDLAKLRDFALRNKAEIVEDLPRVAPLIKIEELRPEFPLKYRLVTFPESKVPNLGDAPAGQVGQVPAWAFSRGAPAYRTFTDKITELRDQEVGQAVTATNQPESVYYVAVSLAKHEPSQAEFLRAYREATAGVGDRRGALFTTCLKDKQRTFNKDFMETLRQEVKLEMNKDKLSSFDGDRGSDDPG